MDLRRMVCTSRTLLLAPACLILAAGAGFASADGSIQVSMDAEFSTVFDVLENIFSSMTVKVAFIVTGLVSVVGGVFRGNPMSVVSGIMVCFFPAVNIALIGVLKSPSPIGTVADNAAEGGGSGYVLIALLAAIGITFAVMTYFKIRREAEEELIDALIAADRESRAAEPASVQELQSGNEAVVTSSEPQVLSATEDGSTETAEPRRPGRRKLAID